MTDKLLIERTGDTERWTLHDPATRNALTEDMVEALKLACERATLDKSLRFVVLQGSGGAFCAGGSLGGFADAIGKALPAGHEDPLIAMNAGFGYLLHALSALPQMLLVAVDGPAMGGGLGLVCCADFVLATPRAVLATPEVTLGVVPAQIAPVLHRRLGDRLARQLLLGAERLNAERALALGLVDELHEDIEAALLARINALRRAAPAAVAHTKELLAVLNHGPQARFPELAAIRFAAGLRSAEAAEGLAAFAQKRKPGWAQ